MLNYLWAFMIIIGIVYGAFTGNLNRVTDAALESASQAVTLCITMAGAMAFWVGMMRIAENAGLLQAAKECGMAGLWTNRECSSDRGDD